MRAALDGVRGKRDSIVAAGLAYIRFALARPGVFRVMFQPDFVDVSRFPAAEEAGARAFAELSRLVTRLSLPGPADVQASLHWSIVHGLASLLIDGALGRKLGPRPRQEVHARHILERFADDVLRSVDADR
jgi:hypothetical protein